MEGFGMIGAERIGPSAGPGDEKAELAPIGEVLGHVATELHALCASAYQVEAAVGALIDRTDPASIAELKGLQELDRLIQHIDGLAVYLAEVAAAAQSLGPVDVGDARKKIKLERLAAGLAGRAAPGADDGFELL
jgi:hypothetical protein